MNINFNTLERLTLPDGMTVPILPDDTPPEVVWIDASIRSFAELVELGQLNETLRRNGALVVYLNLHYLIGSRMDRPMDERSPNTLRVVCDILNDMMFNDIVVHWAHSQSTLDLLNARSAIGAEREFIFDGVNNAVLRSRRDQAYDLILPDAGAAKRYWNDHHAEGMYGYNRIIECGKHRDMKTGKLSGFYVPCGTRRTCVIVDDLCDGGGTFIGLAKELRKNGAAFVGLVAYHGIFSKGQDLEGIDFVYTSNSFKDLDEDMNFLVKKVV